MSGMLAKEPQWTALVIARDGLNDYAAAALLHATCNMMAPRTAALERVVMMILQLALGMVSARSRYQPATPCDSPGNLVALPRCPASRLIALPAALQVALRCFAARCANENMPTFFCLAFDHTRYHTSPGMPSSARRRTRHVSAASQRSSSSSPARTCRRFTLSPAHGP